MFLFKNEPTKKLYTNIYLIFNIYLQVIILLFLTFYFYFYLFYKIIKLYYIFIVLNSKFLPFFSVFLNYIYSSLFFSFNNIFFFRKENICACIHRHSKRTIYIIIVCIVTMDPNIVIDSRNLTVFARRGYIVKISTGNFQMKIMKQPDKNLISDTSIFSLFLQLCEMAREYENISWVKSGCVFNIKT